jgi:L-rhamnose mutarotase
MQKRIMRILKRKPGEKNHYTEMHNNIWQELLEEHYANGTISVSSFFWDDYLLVYFEFDSEKTTNLSLEDLPVRKRWQEAMKEVIDASFKPVDLPEVFFMRNRETE